MKKIAGTIWVLLVGISMLVVILLPLKEANAQQAGGIAISGSFYRHHFKLVPGESFSSPDVAIVIFNNYSVAIDVVLSGETPDGVIFDVAGRKLNIPPNENVTVPVGLSVGDNVVPGDYDIGISADVVPGNKDGISIVGSAQMRTTLTVFGKAGSVMIKVTDPAGTPFAADVKVFQVANNNLEPSSYVFGDVLEDRLVPGEYVVIAYFEGTEVATQKFTIAEDEKKTLDLKVNTAFVVGLTAVPQLNDSNKRITSARINYTVKNVYKPIKNVIVYLNVSKGGKLIEQVEMYTQPELVVGSQDSRYTYIPSAGWSSGEYEFSVQIDSENKLQQAISKSYILAVPTSATGEISSYVYMVIALVVLALGSFFFYYKTKIQKHK